MTFNSATIRDDEVVEDYFFVYRQVPVRGSFGLQTWDFVRTQKNRCTCGDCDAAYDEATWVEDEDSIGNPMLVCPCGGQLYSTKEG